MSTRNLPAWTSDKMRARDGGDSRCVFCGQHSGDPHPYFKDMRLTRFEIEHVIPVSRGGSNDLENLVWACRPCNRLKRTMTGDEFRARYPKGALSRYAKDS